MHSQWKEIHQNSDETLLFEHLGREEPGTLLSPAAQFLPLRRQNLYYEHLEREAPGTLFHPQRSAAQFIPLRHQNFY